MPGGVAVPVDGGYRLNGRWQFSSGTDHCEWIFLGALVGGEDGAPVMPPVGLHVILPRSDYEIIDDSWDVVGLRGTGSKDIVVKDAFIPEYRVMNGGAVIDGTAAKEYGVTETLYRMPWSTMFPLGITSATIGICEGVLAAGVDYQRGRVGAAGTAIKTIRTSCTPSARPLPRSTRPGSNSWRTSTDLGSRRCRQGGRLRDPGDVAPQPGALGMACRPRRGRSLRPVRRKRPPRRQPLAALLAGCARRPAPRHPRHQHHLSRVGHGLPRNRRSGRTPPRDDLTPLAHSKGIL